MVSDMQKGPGLPLMHTRLNADAACEPYCTKRSDKSRERRTAVLRVIKELLERTSHGVIKCTHCSGWLAQASIQMLMKSLKKRLKKRPQEKAGKKPGKRAKGKLGAAWGCTCGGRYGNPAAEEATGCGRGIEGD